MKKVTVFIVILFALFLAGCGSSLKDELVNTDTWDGISSDGNAGKIVFKNDGTFIAKYRAFETGYKYEISEDEKQITYWKIRDKKKEKAVIADVEKTDDGYIFKGKKEHDRETITITPEKI